jgi:hypothetical protein
MEILLFLKCFATFLVSALLIGAVGIFIYEYGYNRLLKNRLRLFGDFLVGLSGFLLKVSLVFSLSFLIYAIWLVR